MDFSKEIFFKYKHRFKLGHLTTEKSHPKTAQLSSLLKKDMSAAIKLMQEIDCDALDILCDKLPEIIKLKKDCHETLQAGNRIFLVGCGATGRLALSIEKLFREQFQSDQVVSFMAGGDYALIKSIERFEDNTEYGKKQLNELGFTQDDLLLAITEGGETSFVIGALNEAHRISRRSSWFLYCNPDSDLAVVERSADVINNKAISKLNLCVGPMAIAGSTRMQATTIQMLAAGLSILYANLSEEEFLHMAKKQIGVLKEIELSFLEMFLDQEFSAYQKEELVTYQSTGDLGIAILTDTTERSPTFNLAGFEKEGESNSSLVYLSLSEYDNAEDAWKSLLGRNPRCLSWEEFEGRINIDELLKFNISKGAIERRKGKIFKISHDKDGINFTFDQTNHKLAFPIEDLLWRHMALKLILNIHSTLLMGKIGRFEGNLMTFVKPSNFKLVNRAQRYVEHFLKLNQKSVPEDEIIELIFEYGSGDEDSPVVLKVLEKLGVLV